MQTKTSQGEGTPPPLPVTAPGRPAKDRYREQYGIVLVCPSEEDQAKLYEALEAIRSCKIKVVVT
ncbi:hypothetical protein [Aureimonas ureilytica]|uniref:hypothetical protein n=1 Tax=Aureimonas ureilytica TaxID=401562 RepID=UPI000A98D859|nr:hypothetical protein [Aureimonas ureilytica]